jgi:hypothetical protein
MVRDQVVAESAGSGHAAGGLVAAVPVAAQAGRRYRWRVIRLWCRLAVMLLAALAFTYLHSDAVPRAATPAVDHAAALAAGEAAVQAVVDGRWQLVYSTDFPVDAPLGSFSGCEVGTDTCTGLPKALQSQWWAYPEGWPDTATERHEKVGGYYSPSTTVWIAGGVMNIRLWRDTGSVHSAAVLPKAAIARTYGKYVETFRIADPVPGYKSAHMLWAVPKPTHGTAHEIDFPEAGWGTRIVGFVHYAGHRPRFPAGVAFNRRWHTTVIEWTPHGLSFYCDGRLIGSIAGNVSDVPMRWVLQNETQTDGLTYPPRHSSSTMQIRYVAYYKWTG